MQNIIFDQIQSMDNQCFISIYLDTRRALKNGKYPVRLRVFTKEPRIQKLYPTNTKYQFSKKQFDTIWNTGKLRKEEYRIINLELEALKNRAIEVAGSLTPFTFETFERKLYRKPGVGVLLSYHYEKRIKEFKENNQIGSASNYLLAEKTFRQYCKSLNKAYDKLTFYDVTPKWLNGYEKYMSNNKGMKLTSVSVYVRTLRTIFNVAISEKEIERDYYPFGKNKYQIPNPKKVKKALTNEQLKLLFEAKPQSEKQEKAKDFWFFSYMCYGINIKDIALLKFSDIENDTITFYRAKTKNTSRANLRPITVPLNDFSRNVIEKYATSDRLSNNYVFDIVSKNQSVIEQHGKIKNFTSFINQNLKRMCKVNRLPNNVTTYWARHSFATNSIRKGASMEFISESLGHSDLKTTQGYFAGFEDDFKREFTNKLMDF